MKKIVRKIVQLKWLKALLDGKLFAKLFRKVT